MARMSRFSKTGPRRSPVPPTTAIATKREPKVCQGHNPGCFADRVIARISSEQACRSRGGGHRSGTLAGLAPTQPIKDHPSKFGIFMAPFVYMPHYRDARGKTT